MKVLGIDPANSKSKKKWSVYCFVCDGMPTATGEIMENDMRVFFQILKAERPDVVVCEDPFLGKNVRSLKQLEFTKGQFAAVTELWGGLFTQVTPSSWKANFGFLKRRPDQETFLKEKMFEDLNIALLQKLRETVKPGRMEDYYDAFCIGLWYENTQGRIGPGLKNATADYTEFG